MKRVLIAEDNPDTLGLLRIQMRGAPFWCDFQNTGEGAKALYVAARKRGTPYDLLVFDVAMPMKTGTTILRYIRENGDWHTPAFLVTALQPHEVEPAAGELGAKVFYKPEGVLRLKEHITNALATTP